MKNLRRNQHGFTHHLLLVLMLVFVVGAAVIGARRIYLLHAQVNPTYVVAVQNRDGCILSGRPWNNTTSACGQSCRVNQGSYTHRTGSDGISRGYCAKAIAESIADNTCVNTYHRFYVREVGCSRRPNQDVNKDNAPQCQPAYPRYMATANPNNCIAPTASAPTVRVASFNILGASHTTDPTDPRYQIGQYPSRLAAAYRVISGQKIDVVGVQEMQGVQRTLFLSSYGGTYGIYPTDGTTEASENSIIWNKSRFSLVSGITVPYHFNLQNPSSMSSFPIVLLKDSKTGNIVAFGNIHLPAGGSDTTAPAVRYQDSQIVRTAEQSWIDQGYPIIFTGDYNSQSDIRSNEVAFAGTNRYKIPYCYIGQTASMAHTYDLLFKRNKADGTCPPDNVLIKVDQVWANTDSVVKNYNPFQSVDTKAATDHDYVPFADIIPEASE